ELRPRLLQRPLHREAIELFAHEPHPHWTTRNVGKILAMHELFGTPAMAPSFVRQLLKAPKEQTLHGWFDSLADHANDRDRAEHLAQVLRDFCAADEPPLPKPLTLARTGRRGFEVAYWNTIAALAHGDFRNKDNADCIRDEPTQKALRHHHRDLEALGEYLMCYHQRVIRRAGMERKAWVGEHVFSWQTDFAFPWSGGWVRNQEGKMCERNIVVRIPGRNSRQAIVMADHYDTAYQLDRYDPAYGGTGARVAAAGADDNHSATAALMLAAPIFLRLSEAR